MQVVDARGLSCPEPVLQAKRALEKGGPGPVKVLVDEAAACENVSALARNMGWTAVQQNLSDHIEVLLTK
ncbi:sulfurtransferase TusA family protein [Phosphitispora sp. TUW77]|uniref:sulfurtransferase TusA family protein n=1 Tax=Phosphitispora sp. TUW77 TaxID=3152361 RepID=UPI003AB1C1D8